MKYEVHHQGVPTGRPSQDVYYCHVITFERDMGVEPHVVAARSTDCTGNNSFVYMVPQSLPRALQPLLCFEPLCPQCQLPEASVVIMKAGGCIGVTTRIMAGLAIPELQKGVPPC